MAVFGLVVIGKVIYAFMQGIPPEAITMGIIGVLALIANVVTAIILYAFRDGDANMKSVWLCSRNDAIGNVAVILQQWESLALAVYGQILLLQSLWRV